MSAIQNYPVEVCDQIRASVKEAFEVMDKFLTCPSREPRAASDEVRAKLRALRQTFLDYYPVLNRIANQISEHVLGELRQIVCTVCKTIDDWLESRPGGADVIIICGSPKQHDNALALENLSRNVELVTVELNAVLAEVRAHQECIARERAVLGDLREQLIRISTPVREWNSSLWALSWRDGVSRDACLRAERKARELSTEIDDVVWELFDYRKRRGGGRES